MNICILYIKQAGQFKRDKEMIMRNIQMFSHVLIIQYNLYISVAINYKYCDNENIK